jgi:hypothetical protein
MGADRLTPSAAIAQPAPASRPSFLSRAAIVVLGPAPATAAVKDVTIELLARQHVDASWAEQTDFRPQDIFAREVGDADTGIAVWIDLSAGTEARLYFRDSRSDRFFLRSLPIARGIDEMAKEEIAHVVANAVLALSTGLGETLTRTEARVALRVREEPALRTEATADPHAWRWSGALLVGGQSLADELPLAAQATGALSLVHRLPGRSSVGLGGWASLGHQFAVEYRGSVVGVTVQSTALRAGLLGSADLSRWLVLGVAVGVGADRIHYSPRGVRAEVVVAPEDTFYVPTIGLWTGLDVRLVGGLALAVRVSSEFLLKQAHFDLHDSGGQVSHVLGLSSVRPGASLGLAYGF